MRHLVLGFCVLSVVAPVTNAFAQNYLPARDYSGPGTIVNMDVLEPGMNAYGGLPLRPPILSAPLEAPSFVPPAPRPLALTPPPMAAAMPAPAVHSPLMPSPIMPLAPSAIVPSIASGDVPLLPPAATPSSFAPRPAPVMASAPRIVPSPTAMPNSVSAPSAAFDQAVSEIAALPESAPLIKEVSPSAIATTESLPFEKSILDGLAPSSRDMVPPAVATRPATQLLTPSAMPSDLFPMAAARATSSAASVNQPAAQPLIQEKAPAIAWNDAPAPMAAAMPVAPAIAPMPMMDDLPPLTARAGDVPPPPSMASPFDGPSSIVPAVTPNPVMTSAGSAVPRIPNADLRQALVLPPPPSERTVLAAINDVPGDNPSLPNPVMNRSRTTKMEMGVDGSIGAIPVTGDDFRSLVDLENKSFAPVDTPMGNAEQNKMAMLPPPTAPLTGGDVMGKAKIARTEDNFEAYRLFFDAASDALKPSETAVLDKIIGKMQGDPSVRLRMQAYAEGTPETAGQARRLSLTRAMKIREYLMNQGIAATRLDVRALGIGSAELGDTVSRSKAPADRVDMIFVRVG